MRSRDDLGAAAAAATDADAVLLDALGTLVALQPPAPALAAELGRRFEIDVTEAQAQRALVAEISEIDTIPDESTFKELGIDSMMGVEIVAAIERQYKVKFDDSELAEVSTLNRSLDLLLRKMPQQTAAAG